jgi:peptidoglycan/LPS O-acetylase OafA/YrhL
MIINSPIKNQHLQQVDYVRAIASLAVALFHMGGKVLPVLKLGYLGVEMFFLLSGFIICWAIPSGYSLKLYGEFISKRIIRIEPPYVISIFLAVLMHFIFNENYKIDWVNLFSHLAYLNNFVNQEYLSPVYWTLGIEFQFYLFIGLLFPLLIIKNVGPLLLLVLCIFPFWINLPVTTLISFFPLFALGILYYLYKKQHLNIYFAFIYGAIIAYIAFLRCGTFETLAALAALLLLILPLKSNRIVGFFSMISFSLYLTHDIIGSTLVVQLGQVLPKTLFYKGLEFISGIMVSIAFAYLFYLAVEKPFLNLSKRVHYFQKVPVVVAAE